MLLLFTQPTSAQEKQHFDVRPGDIIIEGIPHSSRTNQEDLIQLVHFCNQL